LKIEADIRDFDEEFREDFRKVSKRGGEVKG
jgi:hypothetical protein